MKKLKSLKLYLVILVIFIIIKGLAYSYDDKISHPKITTEAAKKSLVEVYLNNQLGSQFSKGLDTIIQAKPILVWLQDGSIDEDSPMCRASNHFHDPTKTWDLSYLTDEPWWMPISCIDWIPYYSNITWATGYSAPPPGGLKVSFPNPSLQSPINWDTARDNYYNALTTTINNKDYYFVKTFEALGHVMHLLEDVSVPAHVRNDFKSHLAFNGISSFNPTKWYIQPYEYFIKNNPGLIVSSGVDVPAFSDIKISDFWDTDQYFGDNPSTSLSLGLAEFTHVNYFSDFTIKNNGPDAIHAFPFPYVTSSDYQICPGLSPDGLDQFYISRKSKGACPPPDQLQNVDHFVAISLLNDEFAVVNNDISSLQLWLDDNVHETYAEELLPRAIDYSAALLDYFFRGELYIPLLIPSVDNANPQFGNENDTGMDIDTVSVKIQNNTEINGVPEAAGAGTLTLTVSYTDTVSGDIVYVSGDTIGVPGIPDMDSGSYIEYLFTLSSPVPSLTAENINYIFAFKGQLGNEADTVIGKVVKGPLLHSVAPDEGLAGAEVTIAGDNLTVIDGPYPAYSDDVRFHHDLTKPYTVEVLNRTDTSMTLKVPDTAGLKKPGYGGLRVRNILSTGERIYSNPVSFFPIAEGEVVNDGQSMITVTVDAVGPIAGDYSPLPQSITIENLSPGASSMIQLTTGFQYTATANTNDTQDISLISPLPVDFSFSVQ